MTPNPDDRDPSSRGGAAASTGSERDLARGSALQGLKVIEIASTIAGPACARLLGDFGADVIKIEPPEGDPVRQMGRHVHSEQGDVSLYAASILRNKRSVALD
uniref:CoA transferase n=1 Tax=uncultured Pseudacidovorax sp. TaxID=679313 RepID=UPI0025E27193